MIDNGVYLLNIGGGHTNGVFSAHAFLRWYNVDGGLDNLCQLNCGKGPWNSTYLSNYENYKISRAYLW